MEDRSNLIFQLYYISSLFVCVPFVISCFRFKYFQKYLIPVFLLIIISILVELINEIFVKYSINDFYLLHVYTVLEFILIALFYGIFFKQYFRPLLFYFFIAGFLILTYADTKINGMETMDSLSVSVESLILTGFSLFLFYYVLKNLLFDNLLASPVFWINTAVLIYFSGNLFLFAFSNYILRSAPEQFYILWGLIHSLINITFNLFIGIGFWKTKVK